MGYRGHWQFLPALSSVIVLIVKMVVDAVEFLGSQARPLPARGRGVALCCSGRCIFIQRRVTYLLALLWGAPAGVCWGVNGPQFWLAHSPNTLGMCKGDHSPEGEPSFAGDFYPFGFQILCSGLEQFDHLHVVVYQFLFIALTESKRSGARTLSSGLGGTAL